MQGTLRALAAVLVLALAGCGSSSTAVKAPPSPSTSTQPSPRQLLGDNVAVAPARTLSKVVFDHWMTIAAKSQASQSKGTPVIVPTDPPEFTACIAQARKQLASLARSPSARLKADCQQLFHTRGAQVLDFLIKAYWYEALAARKGIMVTDGEVQQAYQTQKSQQFPGGKGYQAFLNQTGQTDQDVLFRVRVNLIFKRLLAGTSAVKLNAEARRLFRSQTLCAPLYRVSQVCGP